MSENVMEPQGRGSARRPEEVLAERFTRPEQALELLMSVREDAVELGMPMSNFDTVVGQLHVLAVGRAGRSEAAREHVDLAQWHVNAAVGDVYDAPWPDDKGDAQIESYDRGKLELVLKTVGHVLDRLAGPEES